MKHITALENFHRRGTKLIPGCKELDYKERLKRLNLPTLSYRRLRGEMLEIYKILTGKYDSSVTSNFVTSRENDSITRGHNLKIFKERRRLNILKNSFIYRSTDVWNSLPQSVVDAPSVQSFEVRIDKQWKNHPIKNYFTVPPLLWTVTFRRMRSLKTMLKTELAQEAGMPNTSHKRTCKNYILVTIIFLSCSAHLLSKYMETPRKR